MTSSRSLYLLVLNFCVVSLLPPICMSLCFNIRSHSRHYIIFEHVRNILFYSFLLLQSFPVLFYATILRSGWSSIGTFNSKKREEKIFNLFFLPCFFILHKGVPRYKR